MRLLPSPHLAYAGAPHPGYASSPPTSGAHLGWTIAPGPYRDPIPDELQVHALEHGHVIAQYGERAPDADVDQLERLARKHLRDLIVAPRASDESGIVLTAWGRIERLPSFDGAAIDEFVERLAGRYDHGWQRGARACAPATIEAGTLAPELDAKSGIPSR